MSKGAITGRLTNEHDWLLLCDRFSDLELTFPGKDCSEGKKSTREKGAPTEWPGENARAQEDDHCTAANNTLPHAFFGQVLWCASHMNECE